MNNLSFPYPAWYLLLCLLLGLVFAFVLYFKNKSFPERTSTLSWVLGVIRFLCISAIAVLLLSPLLKSVLTETKKPVVVLAQDASESILAEMSPAEKEKYQQDFTDLSTALKADYDVKEYAFGNEVREGINFDFQDKASNISDLLGNIYDLYSNQNLGAVIMATDGIYNEGSNPIYAGTKLAAPIYTIALGDTIAKKDVIIKRIFSNRIAYLGDKFTIQIDVSAINCVGENTSLTVSSVDRGNNNVLQRFPISINKNNFFTTKEITLDANRAGVQRYRITVNKVNGEVTTANNTREIFIDVLDARQKILLLANTPHPDISAIKQSISKNKNYEVKTALITDPSLNIAAYDFVVLHQLPGKTQDAATVLSTLRSKKIPHLFVVGTQSALPQFNQAQSILTIKGNTQQTNAVQPIFATNFSSYNLDNQLVEKLPGFAPLTAPFGDFTDNANSEVLLYQRIGKVDTKYPLLLYGEDNGVKIGVLAAEGIWKWRLFDYLQNQNHQLFDELLGKAFQFLSVKEDKRKFRVDVSKNIFNENEAVFFDAELYNNNYERINDPDATIVITDSEGKNFNFTFSKTGLTYTLNAGFLPVGNYSYRAAVMSNGVELDHKGQFSIRPVQLEVYETTADHGLLRLLSARYGGELIYADQLSTLPARIKEKGTIKPIIYETSKTRSVINIRWLCFILLGLLTLEWFLRRYFGTY